MLGVVQPFCDLRTQLRTKAKTLKMAEQKDGENLGPLCPLLGIEFTNTRCSPPPPLASFIGKIINALFPELF